MPNTDNEKMNEQPSIESIEYETLGDTSTSVSTNTNSPLAFDEYCEMQQRRKPRKRQEMLRRYLHSQSQSGVSRISFQNILYDEAKVSSTMGSTSTMGKKSEKISMEGRSIMIVRIPIKNSFCVMIAKIIANTCAIRGRMETLMGILMSVSRNLVFVCSIIIMVASVICIIKHIMPKHHALDRTMDNIIML